MYRIILFAIAATFEFLANDRNNYLDWSLQAKAILTDRQLWDIVEGTRDPPKAEKNDVALGLIRYSYFWFQIGLHSKLGIDKLRIDKLGSITSAKIVWDALAAICALPKSKLHIGISRSLSKMHMLKHFLFSIVIQYESGKCVSRTKV